MEDFSGDLITNVVAYFNTADAVRFGTSSRRMYYLTHQYGRILGPQLVAGRAENLDEEDGNETPLTALYKTTLLKLRTKPNLALAFNTEGGQDLFSSLKQMPSNSVVLGAEAPSIQANCEGSIDFNTNAALMLGSFLPDRTNMLPFHSADCQVDGLLDSLQKATPEGETGRNYWKVFIIYVCGSGYYSAENFVAGLQAKYPDAAIVGGICEGGYVTSQDKPKPVELENKTVRQLSCLYLKYGGDEACIDSLSKSELVQKIQDVSRRRSHNLQEVENGIFGLGLGGDVPVRSIVSRGVRSVSGSGTVQNTPSKWYVEETRYVKPDDEEYPFRGDSALLKPIHFIETIQDTETGESVGATSLFAKLNGQPEFVGISRPNADGFELHPISPFSFQLDCFILMTDGSDEQAVTFEGANLDFFALDAKACNDHLDDTLAKLKEVTVDEVLLGGVMFSCNGRGPERHSMLRESMADATRFKKHFPEVPCLGFYAGGEIGPAALVGNRNVYQQGKAAVQGFTVVFALFIVPVVEPGSFRLDDTEQNISDFLRQHLP